MSNLTPRELSLAELLLKFGVAIESGDGATAEDAQRELRARFGVALRLRNAGEGPLARRAGALCRALGELRRQIPEQTAAHEVAIRALEAVARLRGALNDTDPEFRDPILDRAAERV